MAYFIETYPKDRFALFKFWGATSAREARDAFLDYVDRPDFSPRFLMITDGRAITSIDASFREIVELVTGLRPQMDLFHKEADSVIVVSTDLQHGMARMLEAVLRVRSAIRVRVVRAPCEIKLPTGRAFSLAAL